MLFAEVLIRYLILKQLMGLGAFSAVNNAKLRPFINRLFFNCQ